MLDALPANAQACAKTVNAWEKKQVAPAAPAIAFPPLDEMLVTRARQHAAIFIRKQNPSGYDEALELPPGAVPDHAPSRPARSLADNAATLYGSWWHTLFQNYPWKQAAAAHSQAAFEALQPGSPDPARSAREWKLFREAWPDSLLAQFLARPGVIAHTELSFLWRIDDCSCLEGVIDLLLIDSAARRGLLVDWKTNRIAPNESEKLREQYRPQLAAYWKAVGEITGYEIEAGIFATATGEFLPYSVNELEAEWERLRAVPPDRLIAEVSAL